MLVFVDFTASEVSLPFYLSANMRMDLRRLRPVTMVDTQVVTPIARLKVSAMPRFSLIHTSAFCFPIPMGVVTVPYASLSYHELDLWATRDVCELTKTQHGCIYVQAQMS